MAGRCGRGMFDERWRYLAARGLCDALGSVEYERVAEDWHSAGEPIPIGPYIFASMANFGGHEWQEWQ